MTDALGDIRRLLPVLDMVFQAEQVKMAKITKRIADLKLQFTELDRPRSVDPMSAATRMGADVLWETWVQDRRALINREIALAYQERENAKAGMIAALSKLEAARHLEKSASLDATKVKVRRASW